MKKHYTPPVFRYVDFLATEEPKVLIHICLAFLYTTFERTEHVYGVFMMPPVTAGALG